MGRDLHSLKSLLMRPVALVCTPSLDCENGRSGRDTRIYVKQMWKYYVHFSPRAAMALASCDRLPFASQGCTSEWIHQVAPIPLAYEAR